MKNLKKMFAVLTVSLAALSLFGCNSKVEEKVIDDNNNAINPWVEVADITKAIEKVGFDFAIPEDINGNKISLVRVMSDEMIEIRYGDDIIVRKSKGNEDNSGDLNNYDIVKEENGFTLKGNDDTYNCITWNKDNYSYSITTSNGLSLSDVADTVNAIK